MAINVTGFKWSGSEDTHKYDFNSLENIPDFIPPEGSIDADMFSSDVTTFDAITGDPVNINSGDSIKTIWGKIKNALNYLLTYIQNNPVSAKVSKAGDTMSGNLTVSRSGYDSLVQSTNGTQKIELRCTTGGYRGVYDPVLQNWLMRLNPDGIFTMFSTINNGNGWIVWYNADDDAVYLNDKYCKKTVHSNTSDLYSETIKYSNGRLITNMRATITANCTSAGFGGYYNSSAITLSSFPVAYATDTIPTVITTVRHINGQSIYALIAQNVSSRTNPGGIYVLRNSSGSGSIEVDIHAEGVWK